MAGETKWGFGDTAATVTGVYSLVSGLSKKKPKKLKAETFKGYVAPAQADLEARDRAKNENTNAAAGATRQVKSIAGSDGKAAIRGILGIQANTNEANTKVEATASNQFMTDKNRASKEMNEIGLYNNQIKNQVKRANWMQDNAAGLAEATAANQGIQSALTYFTEREGDTRTKEIDRKQTNQALDLNLEKQISERRFQNQRTGAYSPEQLDSMDKAYRAELATKFAQKPVTESWLTRRLRRKATQPVSYTAPVDDRPIPEGITELMGI